MQTLWLPQILCALEDCTCAANAYMDVYKHTIYNHVCIHSYIYACRHVLTNIHSHVMWDSMWICKCVGMCRMTVCDVCVHNRLMCGLLLKTSSCLNTISTHYYIIICVCVCSIAAAIYIAVAMYCHLTKTMSPNVLKSCLRVSWVVVDGERFSTYSVRSSTSEVARSGRGLVRRTPRQSSDNYTKRDTNNSLK